MQTKYYSIYTNKIVKKTWLLLFLLFASSIFFAANLKAQTLIDDYSTTGITYGTSDGTWVINTQVDTTWYEGQTDGVTTPEHSFVSYDLTRTFPSYSLGKANENTWFGWIDLNRTSVSGWGASSYSAGMVLAANSSDFNDATTTGYAVVFDNDADALVLIRFDAGITDGTANLPGTSTEIISSGYTYADSDNGVNFFVSYDTDGKWTVYYKTGASLSATDAVDYTKYNTGNSGLSGVETTYFGATYKYTGWIYAHNNGSSELAYFDNLGAGFTDNAAPETTYNPYDTEEGTPVDGTITITFNEAIRYTGDTEITNGDVDDLIVFKETDNSGLDVTHTTSIDVDKKVITITPSSNLAPNQLYYVGFTATSVEDVLDNAMTADESITFKTIPAEPDNNVNSLSTATPPPTYKDITISWNDNHSGTNDATGFLVFINTSGSFLDPEDGVPQDNQTDLQGSNDGVMNIGSAVQLYKWENLKSDITYNFKIYAYTGTGDNINYKIDGTIPTTTGTTDSAPDSDSFVEEPTSAQINTGTISSLINSSGAAVDMFSFDITDKGTADGLVTEVTNVRVRPHTTNTTDWTETIQGVVLNDGSSDITIGTPDITDTYIDIPITSGNLTIVDGTSETLTLSVYLNTDSIVDGQILSFYIDYEAPGFEADEYGGSTFDSSLPENTDITSNDFTITVVATELQFSTVPTLVNVGVDFTVEVAATDANGNIDLDNTASVTLAKGTTGTGTVTSADGVTASLSSGTHSWDDVKYDTEETFDLEASASGLTLVESSIEAYAATAATPGSVIISEFIPNPDAVTDANGEYIELYNSNDFVVDIENWTISDDGSDNQTISGSLTIPAGGFIALGKNNANDATNGNYTADYDYDVYTIGNTDDEIILKNASTEIIDRVDYTLGSNNWVSASSTIGKSIIYTGTINDDNNDASNWIVSEYRESGFLDGTGDLGSPGTNGYKQNLVTSTTWEGTGNWSEGNLAVNVVAATDYWTNGYPGSVTDVTVNGILTVNIDTLALCNDLTITATDSLIISPGQALTVNGGLITNNELQLSADLGSGVSSLITYGTIDGNTNVQSYFDNTDVWYLISSPITSGKGEIFTDDYFYSWGEPLYAWTNEIDITYSLDPGTGYTINKQGSNTVNYTGILNTGTVPTTLSHTISNGGLGDSNDGWNLLGNPYPSVLDASLFDFTNIAGGIYVYLHNDVRDTYVFWSKTLGTVGSTSGDGDDRARYIQPGQGFWANSNTDAHNETFSYTNDMRTHFNQGEFSKSTPSQSEEKNYVLKIMVSGNGLTDPTYIAFRTESSLDYDREYDLRKMLSRHPEVPHIFSLAGAETTEKLAVNAIESPLSETTIPLGLRIGTDGEYRLYFDGMNSFEEAQDFYLRDRLNGELYDIRLQPMLEFNHLTSNPEHRFDLVMGLQTDINNTLGISLPAEVYSFRNTLYIRPAEKQKTKSIEVKNLLGQTVYSSKFTNSFKTGIQLNLPTAFYLVDIQFESGSYSKKIFIQNLN